MLSSELRGYSFAELKALSHSTVEEMANRIDEAEESKAEVHRSYDMLAEVAEVYETQAKVLREECEKAANNLRAILIDHPSEVKHFDVEVLHRICDGLFAAVERARKIGDMEG